MDTLTRALSYLFYPNPGNAAYASPKAGTLLVLCALLIVLAVGVRFWRLRLKDARLKKLSASWSALLAWVGGTGLVLVVARVEQIQFLSMRFLWLLWLAFLVLVAFVQYRSYRARYYEVMPRTSSHDPRSKYLPGR